MKKSFYEMTFDCAETCLNGKERRIKKTVLSPIFRNNKHVVEIDRIQRAVEALMDEHYYDIAYLGTKRKTVIFSEEVRM